MTRLALVLLVVTTAQFVTPFDAFFVVAEEERRDSTSGIHVV